MTSNNALQELSDLTSRANQEIDALLKNFNETSTIDIFITTQIMRTLHTMKGLANLCNFKPTAQLIHLLETLIDQLATQKIKATKEILSCLSDANTVIFSVLKHGQEAVISTLNDFTAQIQALINTSTQLTKEKIAGETLDYLSLGLESEDIIKISQTEKLTLEQTYKKNRPIISYLVHLELNKLEEYVNIITSQINDNGNIIALIPTHAKIPKFPYAFIFLFTTALTLDDLTKKLIHTGTIIWILKGKSSITKAIGKPTEQPKLPEIPTINIKDFTLQPKIPEQKPQITKQEPSRISRARVSQQAPAPTQINFELIQEKLASTKDPVLHVQLSKIDKLIEYTNKLISRKIKLEKIIKKLKETEKTWDLVLSLEEQILSIDKNLKLLQQAILNARLVKAETIALELSSLVTNIARENNKEIIFETIGKDIEIDKSILDGLEQPLVHLIKNAIDHGIKSPSERTTIGKSPEGHITLSFSQEGNNIVVSLEDDGQGLDLKTIKKKALEKKLIDPIKASSLTPQEIYQFIFIPGFSTKEDISQTSGRGIGMNTVKETVEKMHGELYFESHEGVGTIFTLKIPSFLSIQRLLRFTVDTNHYAIPFTSVNEVIPYEKTLANKIKDTCMYSFHNKLINLISLSSIISKAPTDHSPENQNIIVLQKNRDIMGILVDEILGQEEIIIRPIEQQQNKELELFSGYADMGDETLVLIINSDKLWEVKSNEKK